MVYSCNLICLVFTSFKTNNVFQFDPYSARYQLNKMFMIEVFYYLILQEGIIINNIYYHYAFSNLYMQLYK